MDMNINLNIKATEICEAINNLTSAWVSMGSNAVGIVAPVEQTQTAAKPRSRGGQAKPEAVTTVATAATAAVAEATSTETAPTFTLEQVRAKLTELSTAGHAPQIKELFGKFGAKKLTEVPVENYAELMAAAEEIV